MIDTEFAKLPSKLATWLIEVGGYQRSEIAHIERFHLRPSSKASVYQFAALAGRLNADCAPAINADFSSGLAYLLGDRFATLAASDIQTRENELHDDLCLSEADQEEAFNEQRSEILRLFLEAYPVQGYQDLFINDRRKLLLHGFDCLDTLGLETDCFPI